MAKFGYTKLIGVEDLGDPKHSLARQIQKEEGEVNVQSLHKWRKANPEAAKEVSRKNGKKAGDWSTETGHIQKIQKIGAPKGGSANTEKQQEARKIQNEKHWRAAGTSKAAADKKQKYRNVLIKLYDLLEDGKQYNLKELQVMLDDISDFKVVARRHVKLNNDLFKETLIGKTLHYSKI